MAENSMDIHEVLEYLPHRYPILLVDRVLECVPGKHIVAVKNVTINEPFFQGHFPNHPVMPGVMIVEALAQASAILSFKTLGSKPDPNSVYYFVGIDGMRFKRPVAPGDQVRLQATLQRHIRSVWKFAAQASVDGQVVAEGELMCTVREI